MIEMKVDEEGLADTRGKHTSLINVIENNGLSSKIGVMYCSIHSTGPVSTRGHSCFLPPLHSE